MSTDATLLFPYYLNFYQEPQQFEGFFKPQKINDLMTTISEYDLGGEGDLFKAPEPIVEPIMDLDPMTASISMIFSGDDSITSQGLDIAGIDSIDTDQLFNDVFNECKKDILAKEVTQTHLSEVLDIKIPIARTYENQTIDNKLLFDSALHKSVSSGCLISVQGIHGDHVNPSFSDFPGMDFETVYGMRRAFSEGDVKILGNENTSFTHSPFRHPALISNCSTEERKEKLSRYRNKKTKRNFGPKVKYACRKALADNQPRIRGRFAKTEEYEDKRQ